MYFFSKTIIQEMFSYSQWYSYSSVRKFVNEGAYENGENWYMTKNNQFTVCILKMFTNTNHVYVKRMLTSLHNNMYLFLLCLAVFQLFLVVLYGLGFCFSFHLFRPGRFQWLTGRYLGIPTKITRVVRRKQSGLGIHIKGSHWVK